MPDHLTPEQRHRNMSAIRAKDTKPELIVRHYLWSHGFRYRLNHYRLPGKPDIVLKKYNTCIFINGCFWHGHGVEFNINDNLDHNDNYGGGSITNSTCCKIPRTNRQFWINKIARNQQRDHTVQQQLASMGWHSITIWECELRPSLRQSTLDSLTYTINRIFLNDHKIVKYQLSEEESDYSVAAEDE